MPLYVYRCDTCGQGGEMRLPMRLRDQFYRVCLECGGTVYRMVSPFVQLQPPTGAALRSHFRRAQEAGAELEHHGVSTAGLFQHAVQVASEQPAIQPPE